MLTHLKVVPAPAPSQMPDPGVVLPLHAAGERDRIVRVLTPCLESAAPAPAVPAGLGHGLVDAGDLGMHGLKFEEMRRMLRMKLLFAAVFVLATWAWDWAIAPELARSTLVPRMLLSACMLLCAGATLMRSVCRARYEWIHFGCVLFTVPVWLGILDMLPDRAVWVVGAHMGYVLGMLVLGLPLRFRSNVLGMSVVLVAPVLAALGGRLHGFPFAEYALLVLPAGVFALFAIWMFDRLYARMLACRQRAERRAHEDPMTGVANRRQFDLAGAEAFIAAKQHGRPLSVVLVDIDRFKAINDSLGHGAGDDVIRAVAQALRQCGRASDLLVRLGGEEFAFLLTAHDEVSARLFAERLRRAIEVMTILVRTNDAQTRSVEVTVSIGVAQLSGADTSLESTLRRADQALYRAKHAGRNRVAVAA